MHPLNWAVVIGWLAYVAIDGLRRARGTKHLEGYLLASRSLPWWAVGLSVMATQLSAITMIGTTGQGAVDGMRFVQFYFGLPVAMVILGVTLVPFLHGAKVYTAYEYLERRFDAKTRALTAFLFLLSRGMSCGTILAAPAVVFSAVFGWPLGWCVAFMGVPTVLYTVLGGVQAVTWADVKQMALVTVAIVAVVTTLLVRIPVSPSAALHIAGAAGRLQAFDFTPSLTNTYTFWSGIIGGTFLMLSYFGTDQSQVQRYLTARSVGEARNSLLISAYWKIPLQAMILLIGVLVFVFYQFEPSPMLFNPAHAHRAQQAAPAAYGALQARYDAALGARRAAADALARADDAGDRAANAAAVAAFRMQDSAVASVRAQALALVDSTVHEPSKDVNYIIPRFVLEQLPLGLAGLFIAGVMAAAMSAIAAELNSLATATVIDFYRRWVRPEAPDAHFLNVSKAATAFWGLFACGVATFAATLGSLIEVVNRFGSFFYGSILGVFLLAMIRQASAAGAFVGLIAGMSAVAAVNFGAPKVSFLWHNVIGAVVVVIVGMVVTLVTGTRRTA
ncbi:Na+/solute symporter [Gemmatirosa kalamazoonensis]|uniref:Na+/solute symporter n=1 Tax=Gemmatirosa kalamazoonensis TaxID=861299 RepID=W0RG45_9BACT|nr:sodium:solute symporter [Gemmatirosa kalamazoonensis]AHG89295.1 Na+/solute symporter [Gemmatirosa kalamazoonensis]